MDMGMENFFCGGMDLCQTLKKIVSDMDKFWLDIGEFFFDVENFCWT